MKRKKRGYLFWDCTEACYVYHLSHTLEIRYVRERIREVRGDFRRRGRNGREEGEERERKQNKSYCENQESQLYAWNKVRSDFRKHSAELDEQRVGVFLTEAQKYLSSF